MLLLLHALACTSSAPDAPDNTVAEADTDTDTDSDTDTDTDTDTDSDTDTDQRRPIVIVMIGDGMGPEQLVAGSLYGWGEEGRLFIEQLPHQGEVVTSSLSGVTDSAASATAMSAGVLTWNGVVGLDRDLEPVETLVELSHRLGLSAGVVTTAHVSHATPAAFTAHEENRSNYTVIAEDQVSMLPDVMMGGGRQYFRPSSEKESVREDDGLIAPLEAAGCSLVYTSAELSAHDPAAPGCLVGLFAEEHLDYMVERTKDTTQPTLAELTLAALERLDTDEDGFFLMVEGARIDMAGHSNSIRRLVEEVVAFDEAVAVAASWAVDRDVLLLVTADHETGGLAVQSGGEAGELPEVTWEHPEHTNTRIRIFGQGGEAVAIDGQTVEHAWVHSLAQAHLEGSVFVPPVVASRVPDGRLSDLRHVAALQSVESNMGVGWNQLESLRLDATEEGLYIGVEGIFSRDLGSVVVLIDRDLGEGTGLSS
ncbi:MAG: alkaline phosphatase, partial [Myxococcota bacterium]